MNNGPDGLSDDIGSIIRILYLSRDLFKDIGTYAIPSITERY